MSKSLTSIPGINIQRPWAELLLIGQKTIETRFYPLPSALVGRPLAVIETPGNTRTRRSLAGIIVFGQPFKYANRAQFQADAKKHLVEPGGAFDWNEKRGPKWGWPVKSVYRLTAPLPKSFRSGIIYSKAVPLPDFFAEAVRTLTE